MAQTLGADHHLCRVFLQERTPQDDLIPRNIEVFQVYDVEGRSLILIHHGNYERNTLGCILIARNYATMNGERAVAASRTAVFDVFMKRMEGVDEFEIEFHDVALLY